MSIIIMCSKSMNLVSSLFAIDFCNPQYYSETGLEECKQCPQNTYSLIYRATECINCTFEDISNIPACENCKYPK